LSPFFAAGFTPPGSLASCIHYYYYCKVVGDFNPPLTSTQARTIRACCLLRRRVLARLDFGAARAAAVLPGEFVARGTTPGIVFAAAKTTRRLYAHKKKVHK
jgi:hypothetical protein